MGVGIIGLTQPTYLTGWRDFFGNYIQPEERCTVPYKAREGQNRILFSDTIVDLFFKSEYNPSFERAIQLADTYEGLFSVKNGLSNVRRVYELLKLGRR